MQPTQYSPTTDFSAEEVSNQSGRNTVRTAMLDAELDDIALSISQIITNLSAIQRDDTELLDEVVTIESLSTEVKALLVLSGGNIRGPWVTATAYIAKDVVSQGTGSYICAVAHTSGTFATDLAAGKWVCIFDTAAFTASAIANVPAGAIVSSNVQAAINEIDTRVTEAENSITDVEADIAAISASSGSSLVGFIQSGTGTATRTVQAKARDFVSISDYSSTSNALANITTRGAIIVPRGVSTTPASASAKDVTYYFVDGGDADNVLQSDGTRGGLYSDYDCKAGQIIISHFRESQSGVSGGGFRDALFVNAIDNDTTDYTAIGNKVTHAARFFTQGPYSSGAYQPIYKDLVGAYFSAAGNVQWSARGTSAITADAWQFGIGIASNEFAINNPASGAGGLGQSVSGAAVNAIVRFDYADEDGTHFAYGTVIENSGKRITAGLMLFSNTTRGYSGHFKHLIYAADAITTGSAIVMPQSSSGDVGTVISYDTNDYSYFDRTNNRFNWIVGNSLIASMTPNGLALGSATTTGTWLLIEPNTTTKSHLRLFQGSAHVTSPADGDVWRLSTGVYMQDGATRVKFTTAPA